MTSTLFNGEKERGLAQRNLEEIYSRMGNEGHSLAEAYVHRCTKRTYY